MTSEQIEQERAAFEAWYWEYNQIPEHHRARFTGRLSPCEARYEGTAGHTAWQAWLARAQQSAWISVDDRLPEPSNRPLLTLWEDGEITSGKYCQFGNGIIEWNESRFDRSRELAITHWHLLPAPPENNTGGSAQ